MFSLKIFYFLCLCLLVVGVKPPIKGTSDYDRESLVYDEHNFSCKDGTKRIAFSQVNDDFCDCPDSSDEPGTPACPKGNFWCSNEGFEGRRIYSSQVWDGICDCCDGTDEEGVTNCPNTCDKLARERNQKMEEELRITKEGVRLKELSIETSKKELEHKKTDLEEKKKEVSKLREELKIVQENRVKKEKEEEEARKLYEEKKGEEDAEIASKNTDNQEKQNEENEEDEEQEHEENSIFSEEGYDDDDDYLRPFKEESKKAKEQEDELNNRIRELERDIKNLEDIFAISFGSQGEFFTLHGKCLSIDTVEYTYELCPFDKVTQKPKKGGSSTNLGKWDNSKQTDEWDKEFRIMRYTGGQKCWGGPDRSTVVEVFCGLEEAIANPQEPNKCEYTLTLYTPAACQENHVQALELNLHF